MDKRTGLFTTGVNVLLQRIKPEEVKKLLKDTYWAANRDCTTIQTSIDHSFAYGVFCGERLIGFARMVTDYATMFWLADVIVDPDFRKNGIGKKLLEFIFSDPFWNDKKGILGTRDAHTLYEKYGFVRDSERFMFRLNGQQNGVFIRSRL